MAEGAIVDLTTQKLGTSEKGFFKSFKEAMNTQGDSDAQKANTGPEMKKSGKDKDIKTIKGNTDAGSKPTPVDTTPDIEYKN